MVYKQIKLMFHKQSCGIKVLFTLLRWKGSWYGCDYEYRAIGSVRSWAHEQQNVMLNKLINSSWSLHCHKYNYEGSRGIERHLDLGGQQRLNRINLYTKNPIPVEKLSKVGCHGHPCPPRSLLWDTLVSVWLAILFQRMFVQQ